MPKQTGSVAGPKKVTSIEVLDLKSIMQKPLVNHEDRRSLDSNRSTFSDASSRLELPGSDHTSHRYSSGSDDADRSFYSGVLDDQLYSGLCHGIRTQAQGDRLKSDSDSGVNSCDEVLDSNRSRKRYEKRKVLDSKHTHLPSIQIKTGHITDLQRHSYEDEEDDRSFENGNPLLPANHSKFGSPSFQSDRMSRTLASLPGSSDVTYRYSKLANGEVKHTSVITHRNRHAVVYHKPFQHHNSKTGATGDTEGETTTSGNPRLYRKPVIRVINPVRKSWKPGSRPASNLRRDVHNAHNDDVDSDAEEENPGSQAALRNPLQRSNSRNASHRRSLKRASSLRGFERRSRLYSGRKERLCKFVENDIIGGDATVKTQHGTLPLTYLDYVASGRPLKCIESYIRENVMPTYANTHTEVSFNAQQTTLFREEARAIIKEAVNATEDDAVIFTGSGATSAVNKLLHALKPKKPLVLIGPYEHHSNILPWLNVPGAKVVRIRQTQDGLLDLDHLTWELKKGSKRQIIGSFSAASNVTGILTDVNAVSALVHKYKGIVLFDYACAGPYVDINMNPKGKGEQAGLVYKDAVFISPHKFVGGPGTPGILIAKRNLFRNEEPHNVGGGTVVFVRRKAHRYISDPEHREEGGTPAILESIRAGLVFKLKQTFTSSFIMAKEEDMLRKAKMAWSRVPNLIILGNMNAARLPIFPLLIYNKATGRLLHHDFVAMVMNDVFGLQVRSGCACAAPYGLDLMGMSEDQALRFERLVVTPKGEGGKEEMDKEPDTSTGCYDNIVFKPGFVRLNLPYFLSEATFNFVIQAVQMVADHAWSLLPLYDFDKKTGKWWFIQQEKLKPKKHLKDVSFLSGQLEVDGELGEGESVPTFHRGRGGYKGHDLSDDSRGSQDSLDSGGYDDSFEEVEASSYAEILKRAKKIFHDAEKNVPSYGSEHKSILHHNMRWFMLPEEAAGVISGDPVIHLPPDDLPFFPGALARRLGLSVVDHKARASMDKDFPVEY